LEGEWYHFDYEPFYVGKGKNKRYKDHLNEAKNTKKSSHKLNKIRTILNSKLYPIIMLLKINLSVEKASEFEIKLITMVGRYDLKVGPLTNQTDGGEGTINVSKEATERQVKKRKQTLIDHPEIIEKQVKKHKETLQNNPNISIYTGKKISANYKNNPNIKKKISNSLKKTYKEHPEILDQMAETQRRRYAEDPSIMEKTHKKRLETYKKNPKLSEKRSNTHKQTLADHPEIIQKKVEKSKQTYKNNPTPWIEAGKKRACLYKTNPDFFKKRSEWYSQDCKKRSILQKECHDFIDKYKLDIDCLEVPSNHKPSKVWEDFKLTLLGIINEYI
jgi:hypothetical protein